MPKLILSAVLLTIAAPLLAAVRLTYPIYGTPTAVRWPDSAFPIAYEIDQRVVTTMPDAEAVISRAATAWSSIADTSVSFREARVAPNLHAANDGHNVITLTEGLFKDQMYVALTTNTYDAQGNLTDADIQIDADNAAHGPYNMQQVIGHELGHLLGLDHAAVLSSAMFPYVGTGPARALESDEQITIAALYHKPDPQSPVATLKGSVSGNEGAVFAAQVVAMNAAGQPIATALTDQQGNYEMEGVPPGDYRIYAEPLDGPVDTRNLSGVWRLAKVTSFATTFMDGAVHVDAGKLYGNLNINTSGAPVKLNPMYIAAYPTGTTDVSLSSAPVTLQRGQTVAIYVGGDGITSGMTTFEVMNSGIRRVSPFRYAGNYVVADYAVTSAAAAGSYVIMVKSGNETAALTGALRVAAPAQMARRRAA